MSGNEPISEVVYTYMKSPHFRVLHTDGAVVGVGPQGAIHMSLFSERIPIPQQMVHKVEGDQIGAEVLDRRVGRGGLVREVDVDAVLSLEAAVAIRALLDQQIRALTALRENMQLVANAKLREGTRP